MIYWRKLSLLKDDMLLECTIHKAINNRFSDLLMTCCHFMNWKYLNILEAIKGDIFHSRKIYFRINIVNEIDDNSLMKIWFFANWRRVRKQLLDTLWQILFREKPDSAILELHMSFPWKLRFIHYWSGSQHLTKQYCDESRRILTASSKNTIIKFCF